MARCKSKNGFRDVLFTQAKEAHLSEEVFADQSERLLSFENISRAAVGDLFLDRSDNKSFHLRCLVDPGE